MIIISLNAQDKSYSKNPQTALDFLTLPMDSRSAGIGDVGIATPTDAYAHQHNPSKYLFGQAKSGLTLSYSPWLRNLVKDMNILALSGYYVIDSLQSASASLRYFSMGDMDFYDDLLQYTGNRSPYQLAFDVAYARKLSQYFGGSIGFRYALADLYPSTSGYKKGWGFATDLSFYFQKDIMLGKIPAKLTAGTSLNNLGTKVSFQKNGSSYFMPMFFRLGAGLTAGLNEDNSLMLVGELLRSLVPTKADKLDDSSISGMFSSISEGGFRSIVWALGAEYSYRNMLFARFGYHHESEECGNRKYLTFGTGIVYKIVHFDFSYLAPTGSRHNSMGNTLRLSTAIDF
jgi:hypothetical protein